MGGTSWSDSDWQQHSTNNAGKSQKQIFTQTKTVAELDPKNWTVRESCDSANHPNSTPVMVVVDHTGSMGHLAVTLVKTGTGTLFNELLKRQPISDPQLAVASVGDAVANGPDDAFQMTQFESDIEVALQTEKIHLAGGGGGNGFESYEFGFYAAARRVKSDAFIKRQKKGYLFVIGDDGPYDGGVRAQLIEAVFGDKLERDITWAELIAEVKRTWHPYFLMVAQGDTFGKHLQNEWETILGENAIVLQDVNSMAEVIVSLIEVNEGRDVQQVAQSWGGDKSLVVAKALSGLPANRGTQQRGLTQL